MSNTLNIMKITFRQEAATCPDVVVADMDCSQFHTNQDTSFTAVSLI